MIRILVAVVCVWVAITLLQLPTVGSQEKVYPPYVPRLAAGDQPIAGIARDEALKIAERHVEELRKLPGAVAVSFSADGLVVETAKPEMLPAMVEGLPVIPIPPVDPRAALTINDDWSQPLPSSQPSLPSPPSPLPEHSHIEEPSLEPCGPGSFRAPGEAGCRLITPPLPGPGPKLLPPPPGVIVLEPDKVREQADKCPEGFNEVEEYGWRFCVDPQNPQPIPPLMAPPIAGIPYETALEIHFRHVDELSDLPGVIGVGLGADGIHVTTHNPEMVPKEVEGVPIIVDSAAGMIFEPSSHTFTTTVRPLHGATFIGESYAGLGGTVSAAGTLTGVVLSQRHHG